MTKAKIKMKTPEITNTESLCQSRFALMKKHYKYNELARKS